MKEGYINASFLKVIFTGAGGVGKTHTVCLLRGVDPPDPNHRQSTDCATKAVLLRVDAASDEQWEEIDLENRKKIIAEAIWAAKETAELKKAVNPPSTQKLQPEAEPKPKSEQHPKAEPKPKLKPEQQQPETDPRLLLEMQQEKLSLQSQPLKTEVDLIKCIHEAAMSGEVGGEILETKWVYAIDTGGQPPFHELLSAFIKGASVCAFVFKLSESLDHRPLVEYWVDGTEVGQPFEHPLSNRQILEQSIQTVQALPSLSDEYSQSECSQSPLLLVIGTHRDQQNECTNETLQDKEETLHEIQQKSGCNFQFNNRGGAERIVFDVNAKNPEPKDKAIASTLRTVIAKAMPKPEKIPLRHYGLELELEHLAITKPVISMEECRAIGGRLNFDENGLKAALRFLHRLNVLLYYPEVKEVKELVFCDPLVLIKIASKVVEHIHRGENTAWKDSRERGLIAVEQLNDAEFDRCFKSQIFTAEHLFKLFKHLLIVAMVKPNQQFFMPSLLNELTTTELEKKRPYSSHCIPLTFQFRKEGRSVYAPSGLFSALVAFLLSLKSRYSELCSWEIAEISGNLYRNIIRFQSHLPLVDITLMNFHTHFEVFAICQRNITHKYLPEVQKIINKGLVEVKKVRNFDHVNYSETFPCKCSKATIKPHLAVIDIREKSWCCPHDKSQGGPLEPTELVWFDRSPASKPCDTHSHIERCVHATEGYWWKIWATPKIYWIVWLCILLHNLQRLL